jgi:hypothetical protein
MKTATRSTVLARANGNGSKQTALSAGLKGLPAATPKAPVIPKGNRSKVTYDLEQNADGEQVLVIRATLVEPFKSTSGKSLVVALPDRAGKDTGIDAGNGVNIQCTFTAYVPCGKGSEE